MGALWQHGTTIEMAGLLLDWSLLLLDWSFLLLDWSWLFPDGNLLLLCLVNKSKSDHSPPRKGYYNIEIPVFYFVSVEPVSWESTVLDN